jgi:uncharacterized coiled-coil DUF342 family protein
MSQSAHRPQSTSNGARRDPARGEQGGLSREVHTLTNVIKQLEEQLDEMLTANEALRKDLDDERSRRVDLQHKVDDLHERLRRSEQSATEHDGLLAEVELASQERSRLSVSLRESSEKLAELESQRKRDTQQIERLKVAHQDASDEVQTVEAQFERAMQMVARTKTQLSVACDERDQQIARTKSCQQLVSQLREERDALLSEVEQSRAALDEIRRSLVDACAVSGASDTTSTRGAPPSAPKSTNG